MNWELILGVGVPAVSVSGLLVYKLGTIDTKLGFLQKTVDGLIIRMDRSEDRYHKREKRRQKKYH